MDLLNQLRNSRKNPFPAKLERLSHSAIVSFVEHPEKKTLEKILSDVLLRNARANFHWESLWSLVEEQQQEAINDFGTVTEFNFDEDHAELATVALENFLFNARALIDLTLYLLQVYYVPDSVKKIKESKDSSLDIIKKCSESKEIVEFFETVVLGNSTVVDDDGNAKTKLNWGELLRELRNKIAHYGVIKPTQKEPTVLEGLTFNYQFVAGSPIHKLLTEFHNGCGHMLQTVLITVFSVDWNMEEDIV